MECREAMQLIHTYIEGNLSGRQLEAFIQHIEECQSCYEELEINFLVHEGLSRLESGQSFDLQVELSQRLEESYIRIEHRKKILSFVLMLPIAAVAAILISFLTLILNW